MSILFECVRIGSMVVKNRFVRSATQDFLGNADGTITEQEIDLYRTLAANEVGLIITAHSYVQHPFGKASVNQNAIYSDKFIDGYKKVVQAVHSFDSKLVIQVSHAGRQALPDGGFIPFAPSAVPEKSTGILPREMTEEEIWQVIEDFVAAMVRARDTGCDGVQLHIAHGYLLAQFISPYTNRRKDMWGGSIENRTRILEEIMKRARFQLGSDYPILVKLNSTDGFSGSEYLNIDDVLYTAKLLEKLGAAAIEVSGGMRDTRNVMSQLNIVRPEQEAYFLEAAKAVKENVNIPVILVGGLRSLPVMEAVVRDHYIDMVALSRPLIKEPDLVTRFLKGQERAACVSCNACFNPKGLKCYYKNS